MTTAPLFSDIAGGPDPGQAWWVTADDGVRLRVATWASDATKGTVLLFPGRTEYIEKYGRAATDLAQRGYATIAIDWRGQGLADRLVPNTMTGHVHHFSDYQRDVVAMIKAATELDLPKPWHLLAHSMGGCIGLRSLLLGLPVQSCSFSAPMWGIKMADALRPVAWTLSWGGRQMGMGHVVAPGGLSESYVLVEPFETNKLTNDPEMYQYMIDQLRPHPELGLGGPSLRWLHEALMETRDLADTPSPDMPCLTVLGSDEQIVDSPRIHDRLAKWPGSQLELIQDGKHELLMDSTDIRTCLFDQLCDFMSTHSTVDRASGQQLRPAVGGQGQ